MAAGLTAATLADGAPGYPVAVAVAAAVFHALRNTAGRLLGAAIDHT